MLDSLPLHVGPAGLLCRVLGLEGGQVEEIVGHLLELGQLNGGVDGETVLE
jgi:hypothetical protein